MDESCVQFGYLRGRVPEVWAAASLRDRYTLKTRRHVSLFNLKKSIFIRSRSPAVIRQLGAPRKSSDIVVVHEKFRALAKIRIDSRFLSTKARSTTSIGREQNNDKATAVSLNLRE